MKMIYAAGPGEASARLATLASLCRVLSMRLGHLHPVPAADFSRRETRCPISRIPIRQHLPHFRADMVGRPMAANAHRLQDYRPEHAHFASEIDREAVDVACTSAGVSLNQRRRPGRGYVGRVTEAIAGSSASNALTPCDAPAHGRGVRVARSHGRSRPSPRQALLQLSKQRVVHGQDDEIRARYHHP